MKTRTIIFLLLITALSCTKDQNSQYNGIIEVNPIINKKHPVIMDSILSEFSILKLETPEGTFLGSVDKLIFSKKRIFISDVRSMNSVFIFDEFGQYINHIIGGFKGPGEFIKPQSITTDFERDILYIFDDKLKKILCFDSNGEFISENKFKYTANDISIVNIDLFAFNAGFPQIDNNVNSYDLLYITEKGKVGDKYLPLKDWRSGSIVNKENSFTEYMDTIWYCPVYNDTIYRLSETGPIPTFHINMGKKFIHDDLAKRINIDDPNSEYQHAISNFQKAGQTLYLGYTIREPESGRNILAHTFYDVESKHTKSGHFLSGPSISNGLFTSPEASTGDYFVGVVEAFNLKRSLEFALENGREIPPERMELLTQISEYDNPYLIFYKVAPF